ncbi:hypothetical protein Asppvi_004308 [Aspergillus pseudoviridinutans]|uniref:Fork-head domain-containing protein n=1 Tax=Aspergillus pseudoviridinutans TaxID=1517512 RepID=A0A9P3ERL5_9EURO|nr:uncharacterized protein Asppvi_004308 [Aspergillus pseudoviridinutans]GIJ85451.1 hypothetical protein Asppvi_004308 [Aspergillus pseudoviridinutans]
MDPTRSGPFVPPLSELAAEHDTKAFQSHSQNLSPSCSSSLPLQPPENVPAGQECILDPPLSSAHRPSPRKTPRGLKTSLSGRRELGFIPITAPAPPKFTTDSPAKRTPSITYPYTTSSSSAMPQSALFTTFPSVNHGKQSSKEKRQLAESCNDNFADFPEPSFASKPPKRTLMDAAPLKERTVKKQKREDVDVTRLPSPQEMTPIEDDGTKPPYSYATLIGMSILRAPNRRLTLAQIYKWISDTFSYYKHSDPGWQNSIRHNLSLNKAFIKQERPKDDPGKGNYWAIEPGMEAQFLKDKPLRRATMSSLPLPVTSQREPAHTQSSGTTTWAIPPPNHTLVPKSSKNVDLSSDATIPASDPALQDDMSDEGVNAATSQAPLRSSPPQPIRSSPPIPPPGFIRQGTPPTPSHPTSSAVVPHSRKRESTTMNDSGYFSSLESSAMRPKKTGHILTSDLDIDPPRIKRGRAEEEIARIRSSSHDISPRRPGMLKDTGVAIGSSPVRGEYVSMLPPPLTPVIKFKKPAKPPPSVSPNTNLRNHRKKIQQMVNSPLKHLGLTDEDLPWSPAFRIQDETYTPSDHLHATFDVFAESAEEGISTLAYGSPEKRSAKRARIDTENQTGTVLADITSVSVNSKTGMQALPSAKSKGPLFPESPSKMPEHGRFGDATHDDFFSFHLFDESPVEVDGVDLLQGFQKIGSSSKDESARSKSHTSRPQLNIRSNTALF